jgi:Zn-dependent M16 (insulinase) family peptidase
MKPSLFSVLKILLLLWVALRVEAEDLSSLKQNQEIGAFRVVNLLADSERKIVGAKFLHGPSNAPVYVIQIETAPQTFMWVDTPEDSNRGLPHSLEHLLATKGTKGRYLNLLRIMRFSQFGAATNEDYNMYCLTSGTGMEGFTEQLQAFLDALYNPDFSDIEAEREFYHFGVSSDPKTKKRVLVEQGTVYNEVQAGQGLYTDFYALNKLMLGESNPFGFDSGGVPEEMRDVTPRDIRNFHARDYRLGQHTGFIFVFPAKESVSGFLKQISLDFGKLPVSTPGLHIPRADQREPKYPFKAASDKRVNVYPFASQSNTDQGEARFGWAPVKAESQEDVHLLQMFFRALAEGERSVLYGSLIDSKTRDLDSEATGIDAQVFLGNSPWFPAPSIDLRGISGNHLSVNRIEALRSYILARIGLISAYPDGAPELLAFNQVVKSYATTLQRDRKIWLKSSPLFTSDYKTDWKEYLSYTEMDPSFIRSLADQSAWQRFQSQIDSGQNIWHRLIRKFHLLDTPYATASIPSEQLLAATEKNTRKRIEDKTTALKEFFGSTDEDEALIKFEQKEIRKTVEIDRIDSRVPRPKFTDHPPLTPDDGVQYKQFNLNHVPVVAVFFDGTPTIDFGLSFDLKKIPTRYHKYLPILPRCFDSLGLAEGGRRVSYSDLRTKIQANVSDFSIAYDSNALSGRADLQFRGSTASPRELETALNLIGDMSRSGDISLPNVNRLRDLVNQQVAEDDNYDKGGDPAWYWHVADAFRHQDDPLYLALNSHFMQAHWDNRLKWVLHEHASRQVIEDLGHFAHRVLSSLKGLSATEISGRLSGLETSGLEKELIQYWQQNSSFFPDKELLSAFERLTTEVQHDLAAGPEHAIREINELRQIVVDRLGLRIDITMNPELLGNIQPSLAKFVESLGTQNIGKEDLPNRAGENAITRLAVQRAGRAEGDFPLYIGFEDSRSTTGGVVFSAHSHGYTQVDRESLIKALSSTVASGTGPHTFHMKVFESGLAYSSGMVSEPQIELLSYYADKVPDLASLVSLIDSLADAIPTIEDPALIDYILQKAFPFPRSMSPFAERGKKLAEDIYDGNEPAKVRRFSEAVLMLKHEPDLLPQILRSGLPSIAPVLPEPQFKSVQREERSIFFFIGPESLLADAEKRLSVPKLVRLYPSDFWAE